MTVNRAAAIGMLLTVIGLTKMAPGEGMPEGWFEFPMSGLDAALPDVDVSSLNDRPAGRNGFIRNDGGHFVDRSGRRVRFLGTNLCFGAAFPEKSEAQRLAVRMAKLGINVVRFHHIDNAQAPRGIWRPDQNEFDPEQLDRLDWLIAKLSEQGIFINLNLHVSRNYPGLDEDLSRSFHYGKALDNFYAPYIQLQQEYARALLSHRNPYTGRAYAADPAVLCVEINNENSLTTADWNDLAELPDPWGAELRRQWNAWLVKRYDSMEQLRRVWREVDEPVGAEMLLNTDFDTGTAPWRLEAPRPAEASMSVIPDDPRRGVKSLQAELHELGTEPWHFQLNHTGLTLENEKVYTFSFWAKSDPPRSIETEARLAREPWTHLGLQRRLALTSQWQRFELTFQAGAGQQDACRVGWGFGNTRGRVAIAGPSLKPGGWLGTPSNQSLSDRNIALTRSSDTIARQADYQRFLMETEQRFHADMMRFLKQDLGLRCLVTNTQASYGGLAGVVREATLSDFMDMHGYWQHPSFPGRPWDRRDWFIGNTSMIDEADGGVPGRIALHRVLGKPFTVSEYNHPSPNDHSTEMFPMLASLAAFQDWDGVYQFAYSHSSDELERPRINSFFDLVNHPGQLVWLPIAATIFRAAAVDAGSDPITLRLSEQELVDSRRPMVDVWSKAGAAPGLPVMRPVQVRLGGAAPGSLSEAVNVPDRKRVSSTGQIIWQLPEDDRRQGRFVVNAPRVRCAVGFLGGGTIELGDVSLKLKHATNDWASIGLAALDDQPIARSKKMLLVAVGRVGNADMQWNDQRTSVADKWGTEPTIAEGIAATLRLPGDFSVFALSSRGQVSSSLSVIDADGDSGEFEIGPQEETLWYLVTRQ